MGLSLNAPNVSLDAAGLVALADLSTIQKRTALTGTSGLLDILILCPGIHLQKEATSLNRGEYPACGALTTGYVFRVENPATVYYLQQIGRTGQLTTTSVSKPSDDTTYWYNWMLRRFFSAQNASVVSSIAYFTIVLYTVSIITLLGLTQDWWGLAVILLLMLARLCNVVIIRRRAKAGWAGASEPGVQGDLVILLSQDRWIRMKGAVDDLKAVTSGQWLRDESQMESWVTAFATLVVYLDAALVSNVKQLGKILLMGLLIGSVALLALANVATKKLQMHGNIIQVDGPRKSYARRLDLARELISESGRDDWAVRMGMIVKNEERSRLNPDGGVTM